MTDMAAIGLRARYILNERQVPVATLSADDVKFCPKPPCQRLCLQEPFCFALSAWLYYQHKPKHDLGDHV